VIVAVAVAPVLVQVQVLVRADRADLPTLRDFSFR
jgi:hypothetical protein